MIDENLARLGDRELMKLFALSHTRMITKRATQVIAELERRGYFYDRLKQEFISCEQWNKRYASAPKDCDMLAKT